MSDFDIIEFRTEQANRVIAANIPPRFAAATVTNPEVEMWVRAYIADPDQAPSLLLAGPTGVGKTFQAYGAIKAVALGLAAKGQPLYWRATSHPDLNAAQRSFDEANHEMAKCLEIGLLLLDDLGAGKQTEWTGDTLYRLVDHRWSHNKPTIYTTNLAAKQLQDAVSERVVSRLGDATKITLKGRDRRWTKGDAA